MYGIWKLRCCCLELFLFFKNNYYLNCNILKRYRNIYGNIKLIIINGIILIVNVILF